MLKTTIRGFWKVYLYILTFLSGGISIALNFGENDYADLFTGIAILLLMLAVANSIDRYKNEEYILAPRPHPINLPFTDIRKGNVNMDNWMIHKKGEIWDVWDTKVSEVKFTGTIDECRAFNETQGK